MPPRTIADLVQSLPGYGDREGLTFKTEFRTFRLTFRELHDRVRWFQRVLQDNKVKPEDKIIIWAPNSPAWVASFLAITSIGAIAVPLDLRSTPEFVERICAEVGPKIVFTGKSQPKVKSKGKILEMDSVWLPVKGKIALKPIYSVKPSDLAEIVYTSGTTGNPKGVLLTHENVISNAIASLEGIRFSPSDSVVALLPLSHMFSQVSCLFAPFMVGARIVFVERLNRRHVLEAIKTERPSIVPIVPRLLDMIKLSMVNAARQANKERAFNRLRSLARKLGRPFRRLLFPKTWSLFPPGSFRCFVSGGAPLDHDTESFFDDIGLVILQGYGLSEASPVVTSNTFKSRKFGSVGKPLSNLQIRIGPDQEIRVKGPSITSGYFKKPQETKAILKDGWLQTGDLGFIDEEGYLFIKGRKKDVIVTGEGMKVYPDDVEAILNKIPGVKDSAVVGLKDGAGESVHAVLLMGKGANNPGAVIAKANANLASFARITGFTVWPHDDFPRTTTMKVRKFQVIEWLSTRPSSNQKKEQAGQDSALYRLIASATKKRLSEIRPLSNLTSDLGLASLDRVELLSAIEDETGVILPDDIITPQTRVLDLERLVEARHMVQTKMVFRPWLVSIPAKVLRAIIQSVLWFPLTAFFSWPRFEGKELLKKIKGPVIFVCNHTSHLDAAVILMTLPWRLKANLCPFAWREYFIDPQKRWGRQFLLNRLYDFMGISANLVPLSQFAGFGESMRYAGWLVDKGNSILIFPEGERSLTGKLLPFKEGVGLLAVDMKIPIVPVKVDGLDKILKRASFWPHPGRGYIRYGEAFYVKSDNYKDAVKEIRTAVDTLQV